MYPFEKDQHKRSTVHDRQTALLPKKLKYVQTYFRSRKVQIKQTSKVDNNYINSTKRKINLRESL